MLKQKQVLSMQQRRLQRLSGLALAAMLAGCAEDSLPPPPAGPAVGMQRFAWTDDTRTSWDNAGSRPVTTTVWYPAGDVEQAPVLIPPKKPIFFPGHAARNAPLANRDTQYPVVLLSHGTGGAALQMMWLGRALAARGFVVAAVDHHGNTAAEPAYDARGFRMTWERIPDLSIALDRLAADPTFGKHIDADDVTAIGFSLGGYTVTGLAGARTNLDRLRDFCAGPDADGTCEPQSEYPDAEDDFAKMLEDAPELLAAFDRSDDNYRDPRIDRVIALAPAIGQAFAPEDLALLGPPVLIVVGSNDNVAPLATNAAYLESHLPDARVEIIEGAGHYVFMSVCTDRGRRYVAVCKDSGDIDRGKVHERVVNAVLAFLDSGS